MDIIEGERIIIRRFRESDLNDFHEYCKDEEIGPKAGWKPHETIEESKEILDKFLNSRRSGRSSIKTTGKSSVQSVFILICEGKMSTSGCRDMYWPGLTTTRAS